MKANIQNTSLLAYLQNKENIQHQIARVYWVIEQSSMDVTDREVADITHLPVNYVWSRRNALVTRGLVVKSQVRRCTITGNLAAAWKIKTAKTEMKK
jgi:hypothetical protein